MSAGHVAGSAGPKGGVHHRVSSTSFVGWEHHRTHGGVRLLGIRRKRCELQLVLDALVALD